MQYAAVTALVAQRIEHLTTDQKVGGSSPSERATESPGRSAGHSSPFSSSPSSGLISALPMSSAAAASSAALPSRSA